MKIPKLTIVIFIASMSVLMYELALVRIFSVSFLTNTAFVAVSIALFGLVAGGLIVYSKAGYFSVDRAKERIGVFFFFYCISLFVFPLIFLRLNLSNDNGLVIGVAFFLAAVPFALANICLSVLFRDGHDRFGSLYAADMCGAAVGVIVAAVLMNLFSAVNVIFAAAILAAVAFLIYSPDRRRRAWRAGAVFLVLLGLLLVVNSRFNFIDIVYTKKGAEKNVVFTGWTSFSRVALHAESGTVSASFAPGIASGEPSSMYIDIDSGAATPVYRWDGSAAGAEFMKHDLSGLVYAIAPRGSALVIGPGGGRDVLAAHANGFTVKGVDINPIIVNDIMKGRLRDFSGNLYSLPGVDISVAEGRGFLKRDRHTYDAIHLPLVDTWASTSAGNMFLVEGYLYTVEAMDDYLRHLESGGMLSIERWELDGARLVPMYLEAARRAGISEPERNILIMSNAKQSSHLTDYIFKTTPFTHEEIAAAERFAETNGFTVAYSPEGGGDNIYTKLLRGPDRDAAIAAFDKRLSPAYDNDPFFFFSTPFWKILSGDGFNDPNLDGGLSAFLVVVLLAAVLCLLFPLFGRKKRAPLPAGLPLWSHIVYFSLLGVAFILVEIPLIQKFVLFLEQPIYSYSVILTSLLLFAGLGSAASAKFDCTKKSVFVILGFSLLALLTFYVFFIDRVVGATIDLPLGWKIILAGLLTAPPALGMGMMLPLGMRRIGALGGEGAIAWCWAVNGAFSVMASILAVILSIAFGFNAVLAMAAVAYAVAPLFLKGRRSPQ